jgi:hypothetical protein
MWPFHRRPAPSRQHVYGMQDKHGNVVGYTSVKKRPFVSHDERFIQMSGGALHRIASSQMTAPEIRVLMAALYHHVKQRRGDNKVNATCGKLAMTRHRSSASRAIARLVAEDWLSPVPGEVNIWMINPNRAWTGGGEQVLELRFLYEELQREHQRANVSPADLPLPGSTDPASGVLDVVGDVGELRLVS